MNTDLRIKAKNDFEKDLLSFQKIWKMLKNVKILNLSQYKEKESIQCQKQVIMLQIFSQNIFQQQKSFI